MFDRVFALSLFKIDRPLEKQQPYIIQSDTERHQEPRYCVAFLASPKLLCNLGTKDFLSCAEY